MVAYLQVQSLERSSYAYELAVGIDYLTYKWNRALFGKNSPKSSSDNPLIAKSLWRIIKAFSWSKYKLAL